MDALWTTSVWRQFGAAIDMLENALRACPDELWGASLWKNPAHRPGFAEFWYIAYHCLFFLDLYLSGTAEGFAPPPPYNLDELDPAGLLPERQYTREELCSYLEHSRQKCQRVLGSLTDEQAGRICPFPWAKLSFAELLLDNMRHVQEHAAQLHLFLGQEINSSPRWVAQTKSGPSLQGSI